MTEKPNPHFKLIETEMTETSSTKVRALIQSNQWDKLTTEGDVDPAVAAYLKQQFN